MHGSGSSIFLCFTEFDTKSCLYAVWRGIYHNCIFGLLAYILKLVSGFCLGSVHIKYWYSSYVKQDLISGCKILRDTVQSFIFFRIWFCPLFSRSGNLSISLLLLLVIGYDKNKKNELQASNFPLVLHAKPLVRAVGQVDFFAPWCHTCTVKTLWTISPETRNHAVKL